MATMLGAPRRDDNSSQESGVKIDAALAVLQPLRDLARNFDIDIASCLDEYLNELVAIQGGGAALSAAAAALRRENADGINEEGAGTPNFTQAALLLQNSTSVYGRKVEYLHSLVYTALNELIQSIAGSNAAGSRKRGSGGGGDVAIEDFHAFDLDLQFLLLDNALPTDKTPTGEKINLIDEEEEQWDAERGEAAGGFDSLNNTLASHSRTPTPNNVTHLSLGGVLDATRLDQSTASFLGGRDSLGGKQTSAAVSRALMTTLQGTNEAGGGNLRLLAGNCDVGSNGALLMPGSSLFGSVTNGEMGDNDEAFDLNASLTMFPGGLSQAVGTPGANGSVGVENGNALDLEGPVFDHDDGDDDYHGGGGFEFNDDIATGEDEINEEKEEVTRMAAATRFSPPQKAVDDPWATLDPHVSFTGPRDYKPKPLRIGVTYRLPAGMDEDDRPSASVTGARTRKRVSKNMRGQHAHRQDEQKEWKCQPFLVEATFRKLMSNADTAGIKFDQDGNDYVRSNPTIFSNALKTKGLIFGNEFMYVARAHAKERQAKKREERLRLAQESLGENTITPAVSVINAMASQDNFDDEHDDYGGGFDFGGGDDDSYNGDGGHERCENEAAHRSNVDLKTIDDAFTASAVYREGDHGVDNLDQNEGQPTFEDLCRAHLRNFAKSAERYAAETHLTKRVGLWQSRLSPLLEDQEHRPEFDIHQYGKRILHAVQSELSIKKRTSNGEKKLDSSCTLNNTADFRTVTKDCEAFEVCRLFLSSLMLCNTGNIIVRNGENDGGLQAVASPESLQIELLDASLEKPMDTYMVPSAEEIPVEEKNAAMQLSMLQ